MKIDPLSTLLIGALGASILGLFGAWIQGRREHSRWLIEKRFSTHESYLRLVDKHLMLTKLAVGPKNPRQIADAMEPVSAEVSTIALLGPEYAIEAARRLSTQLAESIAAGKEAPGFSDARVAYVVATRRAVKVSWWPRRVVHFFAHVRASKSED